MPVLGLLPFLCGNNNKETGKFPQTEERSCTKARCGESDSTRGFPEAKGAFFFLQNPALPLLCSLQWFSPSQLLDALPHFQS